MPPFPNLKELRDAVYVAFGSPALPPSKFSPIECAFEHLEESAYEAGEKYGADKQISAFVAACERRVGKRYEELIGAAPADLDADPVVVALRSLRDEFDPEIPF